MGVLKQAISTPVRRKVLDLTPVELQNVVGWKQIGGSSAYGYYKDNQYENGYSSISKLANGFAAIEPYTIDKKAKAVASNILDRIYTPNTDMSAYDFREALAVTSLVHDKVHLRVHHNTERINADSIVGFTFLEDYTENIIDGKRHYRLANGDNLTDDEVITLKSINPESITNGFSPSRAARRWTKLEDYIADYQKGFFENGAIPQGQLIITARTTTEYNDIVDMLQKRHRGAGKNNNVTYTHRPTDQNGSPLNSQIEWVPFSSQNKHMGLKEIFDQVNQKIDSAYGVPASIRAVNDQNTYASVRVDEVIFVKYALNPMTLKIWSKFTHELNRITGGTGVAVAYDLDIPQIADEEKVKAEAKSVDAATVASLVEQGFTLESSIEYINTGELYSLVIGQAPRLEKPEVTSAEELRDLPAQPIDAFSKALEEINDKLGKLNEQPLVTKKINDIDRQVYIQRIRAITKEQMERQVNRAIAKLDEAIRKKAYGDTTEEEDKLFTSQMLASLLPLIAVYGNKQTNNGAIMVLQAGLSTDNIKPFEFTAAQQKAYERYLAKVGTGYADQTAESIRQILGEGILEGQTKDEIASQLREVILGSENEYRVERLARTEVNLSEGRASVSAMENIQRDTGYSIYKVWNVSSDEPCEFCQALDGEKTFVEENFVDQGDTIEGRDGGILQNDFSATDTADAHPNCNCYTTYEIERS